MKEIDFSMNKVRRKLFGYRAKKVISYFVGFPLMLIMVALGSLDFFKGSAFTDTKYYGIIATAALWLLVTILQLGFSLFSKNYKGRAAFSAIIAIVVLLGGALGFDMYASAKIDEVRETYAEKGVELDAYTKDVNYYVRPTSKKGNAEKLNDDVAKFSMIYNVSFEPKVYGTGVNADKSEYFQDEETGAYYNENGMYPDGYVFGVKDAVDILITYHEVTNKYAAKNKNVDTELNNALAALENNAGSKWRQYKLTAEYQEAYADGGTAYKYMLSMDRVEAILQVLGTELDAPIDVILNNATIASFINGILPAGLTVQDIQDYIGPDLSVAQISQIINALGIIKDGDGNPVTVDEEYIEGLLRSLSFYQMPHLKPIYAFIEDEDLQAYAFAKYYATQHGALVGSVLIGDTLGEVTIGGQGFPAEIGYSLSDLYTLKAKLEYATFYYPLFAARRYMYVFGGLVALSFVFAYHYGNKEREYFEEIYSGEGR